MEERSREEGVEEIRTQLSHWAEVLRSQFRKARVPRICEIENQTGENWKRKSLVNLLGVFLSLWWNTNPHRHRWNFMRLEEQMLEEDQWLGLEDKQELVWGQRYSCFHQPEWRALRRYKIQTSEVTSVSYGAKLALEERLCKPALKGFIKHKFQSEVEKEKKTGIN